MITAPRVPSLGDAERLDRNDELAAYRDRFLPIDDSSVIAYLDGNSLGRPLKRTLGLVHDLVADQWSSRMIRGWQDGWLELPQRLGDRLGAAGLGAGPGQVILADSTTVCLYKVLRAAVSLRPGRTGIVTDTDNFPTDRYVVEAVADELGMTIHWIESDPSSGVTEEQVAEAVGPDTAVVTLSHVAYRSAFIADMEHINSLVHAAGGLAVWDLCHSVGSVPVSLDASGADFAVGCTYKFLNAGPGAPGFLYVREEHQAGLRQPIPGWMSARDRFAMAPEYAAATGVRRMLSGTPAVTGLAGVAAGVELLAEAGIERIRAKSTALTRMAIELCDAWLVPLGFAVGSPREEAIRGGHVTVTHPRAAEFARTLIDNGVIIDFRAPDGIRVGLSPLCTSFTELWAALDRTRVLASEALI
ncbi:aminotransferase class V-fold PLP-dependent enzyme [Streptomyces sp. NPDC051662]|uniref:kynureninase n=1 Tax=Streptomyces sp. NPDC051662 TaxID=3154750 RepID=UPI00343BE719